MTHLTVTPSLPGLGLPGRLVQPDDDLASAVAEARRVGLPQLPVCADRRVVGIFSLDRAVRLHVGEPPEEEALAGAG